MGCGWGTFKALLILSLLLLVWQFRTASMQHCHYCVMQYSTFSTVSTVASPQDHP